MRIAITTMLTFILCLWCCLTGNTQVPYPEWEHSFGGSGNEAAYDIQMTPDSGFIVVGYTTSCDGDIKGGNKGLKDFWILKLNRYGILQWERTYGGSGNDAAQSVQILPDGRYLVFGVTDSKISGDVKLSFGNLDWWLLVLDKDGSLVDQHTYGGDGEDRPGKVFCVGDQEVVMIGTTNSSSLGTKDKFTVTVLKVKLNNLRSAIFQEFLVPPFDGGVDLNDPDNPGAIARQTSDKGFIICGTSFLNNYDYLILKIDSTGKDSWWRNYGTSQAENATDVLETKPGEYIVIGDKGIGKATWILKLDSKGDIIDSVTYDGDGFDVPYSILKTLSNEFVFCGFSNSKDFKTDRLNKEKNSFWVASFTNTEPFNDMLLWSGLYGGEVGSTGSNRAYKVLETSPNQFVSIGMIGKSRGDPICNKNLNSDIDLWIVKLNSKCTTFPELRPQARIDSGSVVCENSTFELKETSLSVGSQKYHWLRPNNRFDTTTTPFLTIPNVTPADTGFYRVFIEQNGCLSRISNPIKVSILQSSPELAKAIADFNSCSTDVLLSANGPSTPGTRGTWSALGPQKIESPDKPQTKVYNLQAGVNHFVWSLSNNVCGEAFSSDTLVVNYLNRTQVNAIPDHINMPIEATDMQFDVLTNDQFADQPKPTISIDIPPSEGQVTVVNQKINFKGLPFSKEPVTFSYKLCDAICLDNCDTAQVTIMKQGNASPPHRIGFTPNEDSKNDLLVFEFLNPLYRYSIVIFNRWGKVVYENQNYRNDWDGKRNGELLPVDTYYYILKNSDTNEKYEGSILLKY